MSELNETTKEAESRHIEMSLVTDCNKLFIGAKAPNFTAESTCGKISLSSYQGKWVIFFSHPRRFHSSMYN